MSMGFIFLVAVRGASPRQGTLIPWDAIGTVASLLISACSMIVVLWQTRIARRAARTAQEAATATSIQARATVEQDVARAEDQDYLVEGGRGPDVKYTDHFRAKENAGKEEKHYVRRLYPSGDNTAQ